MDPCIVAGIAPTLTFAPALPPGLHVRWPAGPGPEPLAALLAAAHAAGAAGLLIGHDHRCDAAAIAALPASVRAIATSSVGFDHLDLDAARRRGIVCSHTPNVLTDCTADHVMLLLLAACRRLPAYAAIMQAGWGRALGQAEGLGLGLSGRTLGILGMGRIGQAVAARARAFGMRIAYCNRRRLPPALEAGATYCAELAELLPRSQVLSLHLPASPATRGIIDAAALAQLPAQAVLINAGRGSLVDEAALRAALGGGRLFAAGLDVFAAEPDFDRRLAALPNVVLTPHVGSATVQTREAMWRHALHDIARVLAGQAPISPL